ncbi:extracellular serine/threonine protein kinase four-jointed [Macrosteles quadrilineatus]|uniref:extracellular serine/threonine protein kinase four-jointed n=1 Tax=Macrosteles quadrilineatus TaxID=74068 RepID=UPI0023E1EBF3|nr:extracellular serine/threonine protein kinase four-jointed [Macrosteles quadrilineatus]
MYSKHPLIDINSQLPRKRRRLLRSHYMFMDLAINPGYGDSGLFVICETTKRSSKRTLLFIAVIVAFILGLLMGLFLPLRLMDKCLSRLKFKNSYQLGNDSSRNSTGTGVGRVANTTYVNGIFWDDAVESSLPSGFTEECGTHWVDFVQKTAIVKIEKGCGRMQNRLVTFEDGTKACCRYRQNTDQIQGEIFSYYLGRLLNLRNVVPSTVVAINSSQVTWHNVGSQLSDAQWCEGHPVVFTKYIQDLVPADIPPVFRQLTSEGLSTSARRPSSFWTTVFTSHNTSGEFKVEEWIRSIKDAVELAQWSDLIIFDYLTGNLDRVVNNLYNLQWNPDMLTNPAHNLARTATSGLLVFLDNESGMLHGYRLLDKYEPYHSLLLNSVCVFRKPTVDALTALSLYSNPGQLLSEGLPSPDLLPPLPDLNQSTLRLRVARVLQQVISCAKRYHVRL